MAKRILSKNCLWCKKPFQTILDRVKCCSWSCAGLNRVGSVSVRFWKHVATAGVDDCWLWTGGQYTTGYGQIKDRKIPKLAHRVSWELAYGGIPDGLWVLHKCDVHRCVNPNHLFLGTPADNSRDMSAKGRSSRGARNPKAKLTATDVLAIRSSLMTGAQVARLYGIQPSQVSHIRLRKQWKHLP